MERSGLGSLLCHLRALGAPAATRGLTDSELLCAYCVRQDQAAFAALVKRHGPLVQAVCAGLLWRTEDREDAFQATFLALARDANRVRKHESIAGWLHGVARHVALDARRAVARRHKYEKQAMKTAAKNPAWEAAWREVQAVLDEEIQRLPARYREPFVLCCLENQSRSDAAGRLGLKEGTVGSRLTEARRRLRQRLARRGVDLLAVLGTTAIASGAASAHVPGALAASIARIAAAMASGQLLTSGLVSARILTLVHGVPKAMFLSKTMLGMLFVLALGILGSGVAAVEHYQAGSDTSESRQQIVVARGAVQRPAAAAAKGDEVLWQKQADLKLAGWLPGSAAYASDGKMLVVGGIEGKLIAFDPTTRKEKWKAEVGGNFAAVAFSADGQSIVATFQDGVRFLEAATGKLGDSLEEKGSRPVALGVFPDRDFFAGQNQKFTSHKIIFASVQRYVVKTWVDSGRPGTIYLGTVNEKMPVDPAALPLAVDPQGRSVIVTGPIERESGKNVLWAWVAGDYDPGTPGNRLLKGHEAVVVSAAWSSSGKTAVTGDADGRVIVWDATAMKETHRLELGGRVAALALTSDGKHLAAVVIGKRAEFYVIETAKARRNKPIFVDASDFSGPVHACLAFSPDGRQLVGSAFCTGWLSRLGELVGHLHLWNKEPVHAAQEKPPEDDTDMLRGAWVFVSGQADGKLISEEKIHAVLGCHIVLSKKRELMSLTFTPTALILQSTSIFRGNIQASYKLDPSKTPKVIEIQHSVGDLKGRWTKNIYRFDGQRLLLCLQNGKDAPTEFVTTRGDGRLLLILKRKTEDTDNKKKTTAP